MAAFSSSALARCLWGAKGKFLKKKLGGKGKSGFAILIALKNQPEKWSRLFFYLLGTQNYPEMFLMLFYATGPFIVKIRDSYWLFV